MVKLQNFLLQKPIKFSKITVMKCLGCKVFKEKIGYEMFVQNRQVTKCFGYKMLGYEIGVTSCGYEMFITKCPSLDMCGNPN